MRRCVCEREMPVCAWSQENRVCKRESERERGILRELVCALSPCHPRVGMLRQTGGLFLGKWQCVNGRRCVAKEGSEISANPGQSHSPFFHFFFCMASLLCCESLLPFKPSGVAQSLHDVCVSLLSLLSSDSQRWESRARLYYKRLNERFVPWNDIN